MTKIQINTKSVARIAAIQTIYQTTYEGRPQNIDIALENTKAFYKNKNIKDDYNLPQINSYTINPNNNYLQKLAKLTYNHIDQIDSTITNYLTSNWTLKTLPKLLLVILRVAMCELQYFPSTPSKVIINEYTNIASEMLSGLEIGFVNSVLDNYASNCGR